MPYCWKCGKNANANAYCGACGTKITTTTASTKKKVYCNENGCDDTGYQGTIHGIGCPLNPKYRESRYDDYP